MKKIDSYIIKAFLGPFLITFLISIFVLVMQFLWKYIDDLVGKGLEWYIIAELLFYFSASVIPMALPLAVLLASIMVYGNLGERYEIAAMKASGISLRRMILPLFVFALILSGFAFFVSNIVIPKANLEFKSLLFDVRQQKPAFNIKENVFYDGIDGINIKVGRKDPDNITLHDVLIYDLRERQGNINVTSAKTGTMSFSEDKRYLFLTLNNGMRYEEIRGEQGQTGLAANTTYSTFSKQEVVFDLSDFSFNRANKDFLKDHFEMLNVVELNRSIDSLKRDLTKRYNRTFKNVTSYLHVGDTVFQNIQPDPNIKASANLLDDFPKEKRESILYFAMNQARTAKQVIRDEHVFVETIRKQDARYNNEWHRKFTLSVACILLFLIGAPLGAIIRKGGFGLPFVIAILFFVLYYVLIITFEKFSKELVLMPWAGMWAPTLLLLPIAAWLVYRSNVDGTMFQFDQYLQIFRKLGKKKVKHADPAAQ